ncbi:MAG: glutamine synthetase beta-grasp domain-containing protein [bacterium]|nr:glutamine synthetase beta-grasp domain-containing protein [bacterium]
MFKIGQISISTNPTQSNLINGLPSDDLVRTIQKDRKDWTLEDIIRFFLNSKIRLVSLLHIGGDGWLKTLDFAPRDHHHLENILLAGERADGSSIFTGMGIQAGQSDIVLRPRIDTAFLDPFSPIPTLCVMCSHYGRDGKPLPESPTTILQKAEERLYRETGLQLYSLAELEYYLGKKPEQYDDYGRNERGYHSTSPFVFGENLRREALFLLSEMGVCTKYGHSEVGYITADEHDDRVWEQHEVELALQPISKSAEDAILAQWVLRNLAHRYGMWCSFSPVIKRGHAGSGMHFHLSAVRNGQHLPVFRQNKNLTEESKWIIGGLVQMGSVLMAFGNRDRTSFIRLQQAKEAPNTVTWGQYNRKALVRIPIVAYDSEGKAVTQETIEYRLSDGSSHQQLLLAAIAQSICWNSKNSDLDHWITTTSAEVKTNESHSIPIPQSFHSVSQLLLEHRSILEAGEVFPSHLIDAIAVSLDKLDS